MRTYKEKIKEREENKLALKNNQDQFEVNNQDPFQFPKGDENPIDKSIKEGVSQSDESIKQQIALSKIIEEESEDDQQSEPYIKDDKPKFNKAFAKVVPM